MAQKIKTFLKSRGVGYYLTIPAVILIAVALGIYCSYGNNSVLNDYAKELSTATLVCCGLAIALGLVSLVFDCKYLRFAAYLLALYAFMSFIYTQVLFLGGWFFGMMQEGGNGGDYESYAPVVPYFLSTAITFMAGIVCFIVGGCLTNKHPKAKKEAQ